MRSENKVAKSVGLGINGNEKSNITESVFLEILMYAADWTNRCGGNTI